jgi:hypothetical protein
MLFLKLFLDRSDVAAAAAAAAADTSHDESFAKLCCM